MSDTEFSRQEEPRMASSPDAHFPSEPSDQELITFVESWIDLLAGQEYEAAFGATWQDPHFRWSPTLLRTVIEGYGLPEPRRDGKTFAATDRRGARGGPPEVVIDRHQLPAGVVAEIRHDLPLNGEWSDLTATFHLVAAPKGFAVVLQEIHVF